MVPGVAANTLDNWHWAMTSCHNSVYVP